MMGDDAMATTDILAPHRPQGRPDRDRPLVDQVRQSVPAPVHAGEGRYPRQPWVPAGAGMDENLCSTRYHLSGLQL
jgi:hypothetical protein